MRVGLNAARMAEGLTSLTHVAAAFREALADRHELVLFPDDYYQVSPLKRQKMAQQVMEQCDVLLSQPDPTLLGTRAAINSPVPLAMMVLGSLPRGFFGLRSLLGGLRANDVLVANSTADVAIARLMFENAAVRLLPFSYSEQKFHPPTPMETAAIRRRLGIPSRAPLVLYSGRCTVEKQVHSVLKVFSVVRAAVPDAHLVLAGPLDDSRFSEFGVVPLEMASIIRRVIANLDLAGRVHVPGPLAPDDLRAVYGAADVAVSLSLHHDENFGLAPVEAMACGTPVVGTCWGGLQDTVAHGEAGFHVGTTVTAHGVKSNWWEAANRIVQLLRDGGLRARFGERGEEIARERFSLRAHAAALETILEDAVHGTRRMREPLRVSDFTRDFWETCAPGDESLPLGRRGAEAYALYRRLISAYAGAPQGSIAPGLPLTPGQVLVLANPVSWNADGTLAVSDLQFPWDVRVPAEFEEFVRMAVHSLQAEPVTDVCGLVHPVGCSDQSQAALAWMVDAGLVLRMRRLPDAIDPALARTAGTTPLVSIRRVEHPAELVYIAA